MDLNPKEAPTEFLRMYGEFLEVVKKGELDIAENQLQTMIDLPEVSGKERILLMLGDELVREQIEVSDVIDEYQEQINAALS